MSISSSLCERIKMSKMELQQDIQMARVRISVVLEDYL